MVNEEGFGQPTATQEVKESAGAVGKVGGFFAKIGADKAWNFLKTKVAGAIIGSVLPGIGTVSGAIASWVLTNVWSKIKERGLALPLVTGALGGLVGGPFGFAAGFAAGFLPKFFSLGTANKTAGGINRGLSLLTGIGAEGPSIQEAGILGWLSGNSTILAPLVAIMAVFFFIFIIWGVITGAFVNPPEKGTGAEGQPAVTSAGSNYETANLLINTIRGCCEEYRVESPFNLIPTCHAQIETLEQRELVRVNPKNASTIIKCLKTKDLSNKDLIAKIINHSVYNVGPSLQCVGFVQAVEAMNNRLFLWETPRNAADYFNPHNPPEGYQFIGSFEEAKVWLQNHPGQAVLVGWGPEISCDCNQNVACCGHLALGTLTESKGLPLEITQANLKGQGEIGSAKVNPNDEAIKPKGYLIPIL